LRHKVKMPKLGDTVNEVVIIERCVDVGNSITEGESLVAVQTDKVDTDVPSPLTGTLVEWLIAPDDEVAVGDPIAVIET
jgi:pyruvate/2-oxoglutarate dehydrogenase complex dihydrolipoamide acyltransferase (E2) component